MKKLLVLFLMSHVGCNMEGDAIEEVDKPSFVLVDDGNEPFLVILDEPDAENPEAWWNDFWSGIEEGTLVVERDQAPGQSAEAPLPAPPLAPNECWYAGNGGQLGTRCKGQATGIGGCCGVAGMTGYPYCTLYEYPGYRPGPPPYRPWLPACSGTPCAGGFAPDGNCDFYDWDGNGEPGYQPPPRASDLYARNAAVRRSLRVKTRGR